MDNRIDNENLAIYKVLEQIHCETNKMSSIMFRTFVCAMINIYCAENGLDAFEETKKCLLGISLPHSFLDK